MGASGTETRQKTENNSHIYWSREHFWHGKKAIYFGLNGKEDWLKGKIINMEV